MLPAYQRSYDFRGSEFNYNDYMTHPRNMDSAGTLQQHDNLRRQISAYEKLLQHAMSKFSVEKCYQMFKALCQDSSDIPRLASLDSTSSHRLISLRQLHQMLRTLDEAGGQGSRRSGSMAREETAHIRRYFETFFEDLKYLKELKRNFDVKIYMCLYEYYYDPSDDLGEGKEGRDVTGMMPDGATKWDAEEEGKEVQLDALDPKQKLSYAVKQMYRVNTKWENMYTDDEVEISWYDPDSFQQLMQFDDFYLFEPLLRLVPDIFTKAFKSIEMAKLWWTQFSRICPQDSTTHVRRNSSDFEVKIQRLENEISRLVIEIMREEDHLIKWKQDLKNLKSRETRFYKLSKDCERLEARRNELETQFARRFEERQTVKRELSAHVIGTQNYKEVRGRLQDIYEICVRAKKDLNVGKYQFDLAQGDLNIELLVRPDMIIFIADLEEKIARAEGLITDNRQLKRKAEKKLALIKTNTENMRRIMHKVLGTDDALRMRRPPTPPPPPRAQPPPPPPPPPPKSSPVETPRTRTMKDSDADRWEDRDDMNVDVMPVKPQKKEPSVIKDGLFDGYSKEDAFKTRSKIHEY